LNTLLLYFLSPQLHGYVGLSGALHGTIVAFGLADWPKNKWTSTALIIGVTAKLIYEQLYGSSESVKQLINANVAVDAHLWGAVSGVLVGAVYLFWRYRRPAIRLVEK
jgi:rhomboid family GlyGly-CTERM serine protease